MPPDLPGLHEESIRGDPFAWAGLAAMLGAAYLAARLATWLGLTAAFAAWSRSAGRHWTERARLSWPGRRLEPLSGILVPFLMLSFVVAVPPPSPLAVGEGPGGLPAGTTTRVLLLVAGYLGLIQARLGWERRVNPAATLSPLGRRAGWILVPLTLAFWIWLPYAIFGRWLIHRTALDLAIVGGGLLAIVAYQLGGWLMVLRWAGLRRPAPERLRAVVARVSERMGIRPRAVEVIVQSQANAMAFPLTGRILVTEATLAVLDDDELSVICAHELAHLGEPRGVLVARLVYGIAYPMVLALPMLLMALADRLFPFETGLAVFSALASLWICGLFLHTRLYHRMEIRADEMARGVQADPGTYARALEKLYEVNATPVVLGAGRGMYPELYDRMVASGLTPGYARPAAPPRWPFWLGLVVMIVASIVGGIGMVWLGDVIQ